MLSYTGENSLERKAYSQYVCITEVSTSVDVCASIYIYIYSNYTCSLDLCSPIL